MIRNSVIDTIAEDLSAHVQLLGKFESELKRLPEGSICVKNIRGKERYYLYEPSKTPGVLPTQTYIRKDETALISEIGRKQFIKMSLPVIGSIIDAEEAFLKNYPVYDPVKIVKTLPRIFRDINYNPAPDMVEIIHPSYWQDEPYVKNPRYPDRLIYRTPGGLLVRSKSESIIAAQLEFNEIPFRYESAITLAGHTYYPDFTILNPRDNRIVYWEHFGMADDAEYAVSMEQKLTVYKKYGIVQWANLITTFETKEVPLDAKKIRALIKAFLLLETL